MAKAVTEKSTKVTKPKKSPLSTVAGSITKSITAKAVAESKVTIADKPNDKVSSKRKLVTEHTTISKGAKRAKKLAMESDEAVLKSGTSKGKTKAEADQESPVDIRAEVKETRPKKKTAIKTKARSVSPSSGSSDVGEQRVSDAEHEASSSKEEDVQMFGFSTDDDDSSDDEMDDGRDSVDVGKLPTIAKDDAVVKRKLEKAKRKPVRKYAFPFFFRS